MTRGPNPHQTDEVRMTPFRQPVTVVALVGAMLMPQMIVAQDAAFSAPIFEVASVKRNVSVDRRMGVRVQPGSFNAINAPTVLVLQYAYALVNDGDLPGAL